MLHRVSKLAEHEKLKAITITFNGGQKFTEHEGEAKPPPRASLCARVIFSAFRFGSYMQWDNLPAKYFGDPRHRGVQDVAKVLELYRKIANYNESESRIFFGVDDIVKFQCANIFAGGPAAKVKSAKQGVIDVYRQVMRLVNTDQRVRILFSTLDGEPMRTDLFGEGAASAVPNTTQASKRRITWLMLDPLSETNDGIEKVIEHWRSLGLKVHMTEEKLKWLAGVCGGHPRSLDFAGQALKYHHDQETTHTIAYSLAEVFEKTVGSLSQMNGTDKPPSDSALLQAFAYCILCHRVSTSTEFGRVADGQWTSTDLIKHGWFINAAQPTGDFVPQLSFLMGYYWASRRDADLVCIFLHRVILSLSSTCTANAAA